MAKTATAPVSPQDRLSKLSPRAGAVLGVILGPFGYLYTRNYKRMFITLGILVLALIAGMAVDGKGGELLVQAVGLGVAIFVATDNSKAIKKAKEATLGAE